MSALREARCRYHAEREASARCRHCGGYFCRECVTEDAGALYCFACLEARLHDQAVAGPGALTLSWHATLGLAGFGLIAAGLALFLYLAASVPGSVLLTGGGH